MQNETVSITKRITIKYGDLNPLFAEIHQSAFEELNANVKGMTYKYDYDETPFRPNIRFIESLSKSAEEGAYHLLPTIKFIPNLKDCAGLKYFESLSSKIKVLKFELGNINYFEIALLLTTKELILIDTIGNKLLLSEEELKMDEGVNRYTNSFFLELTDDIYFEALLSK